MKNPIIHEIECKEAFNIELDIHYFLETLDKIPHRKNPLLHEIECEEAFNLELDIHYFLKPLDGIPPDPYANIHFNSMMSHTSVAVFNNLLENFMEMDEDNLKIVRLLGHKRCDKFRKSRCKTLSSQHDKGRLSTAIWEDLIYMWLYLADTQPTHTQTNDDNDD